MELDLEELDKVEEAGEVEVKIEDLDLEDGAEIVSHDQGEVVLEIEVKEKDEGGKENDGCKELEAVAREDEGVDEEGNNDEGNDNNK